MNETPKETGEETTPVPFVEPDTESGSTTTPVPHAEPATEPEPDADTIDTTDAARRPRPKWLVPVVAGVTVVAIAGAGAGGYAWWSGRRLSDAKSACAEASETLRVARNSYDALADGDAATASGVAVGEVADKTVLDTLATALGEQEPEPAACNVDGVDALDEATDAITENTGWYAAHEKSLRDAADAVIASRLDKTVTDARKTLDDSKGKVADEQTRTALQEAIDARDADGVAKAVKGVNDSISAKTKADEEAKRKADEQAAADAAAAAAQQQAGSGYTNSGYTSGGYTGSGYSSGGTSGGGSTYTPSTSGSSGSSWDWQNDKDSMGNPTTPLEGDSWDYIEQ